MLLQHRIALYTLTDSSKLEKTEKKISCISLQQRFVCIFGNTCEGMLATLNLSTPYFRWRHLDVISLTNVSKTKLVAISYTILLINV
jgi:hypothetical protein